MGFVFKARQPKLDRLVALKILPQSLATDPAFAERFTREGRALARLNHQNIVTVHDFGHEKGFFYLLMEYVDGVNLRQAMKAGRFTASQALAVVPKICEALQYAHSEGVLHRDIKPENILLDTKGRVKIVDFGIAKLMGDGPLEAALTDSGGALGTPHYMAPEQLEQPSSVDHRADVYSLGVVFYEMLTGELPIGRFPPPSQKSMVDPRVDEVVLRALEKQPERRTQSAGEVKTQVETIAGRTGSVGAERPSIEPLRRTESNSWRTGMLVTAAIAVLASLAWLTVHLNASRRGSGALLEPQNARETTTVVLTRATNDISSTDGSARVSAWTDASLGPGISLLALVRRADGKLGRSHEFVNWRPNGARFSSSFSWIFGGPLEQSFDSTEAEAAFDHLRANIAEGPLILTNDAPFQVFSVTNGFGAVMAGYLLYKKEVAEPTIKGEPKPQAIVHVRSYAAYFPSMDYTVEVPRGYSLRMTANMGVVSTFFLRGQNLDDYHSSWLSSSGFGYPRLAPNIPAQMEARRSALETQFQALRDRGPIPVVLGEPLRVFCVTNQPGEIYSAFLELVGPSAQSFK
jgi:serine/threonine protein kinase